MFLFFYESPYCFLHLFQCPGYKYHYSIVKKDGKEKAEGQGCSRLEQGPQKETAPAKHHRAYVKALFHKDKEHIPVNQQDGVAVAVNKPENGVMSGAYAAALEKEENGQRKKYHQNRQVGCQQVGVASGAVDKNNGKGTEASCGEKALLVFFAPWLAEEIA